MAYRRTPFAVHEWYHLYSQGIDKRNIFLDKNDFKRFQALLYLTNNVEPVNKDGGITSFMRKLGTAYTMYFDRKYNRIGNLLVKPFRSKHIEDDRYLGRVVQYVHLNPAQVLEHGWKKGRVRNIRALEECLLDYTFSSLPDYFGNKRPECSIIDNDAYDLLSDGLPKFRDVLDEATVYYSEIESEFISHSVQ